MRQLAQQQGHFGNIRILERVSDGARLYVTGDGLQSMAFLSGESLFGYLHALKLLLRRSHDILMIGGAGGSLATMLARRGHKVTVVDIDPVAQSLAEQFFNLHPQVKWITADAISYLKRCRRTFDAIVVDACDARSTISAFTHPDWLTAATRHLRPGGRLLLNLAGEYGRSGDGWRMAKRMAGRGYRAVLFRPEDGWEGNEILQITQRDVVPSAIDKADIFSRPGEARTYLLSLKAYSTG